MIVNATALETTHSRKRRACQPSGSLVTDDLSCERWLIVRAQAIAAAGSNRRTASSTNSVARAGCGETVARE
jgi:hypothetical protein